MSIKKQENVYYFLCSLYWLSHGDMLSLPLYWDLFSLLNTLQGSFEKAQQMEILKIC